MAKDCLNLAQFVVDSARIYPDNAALKYEQTEISYAQFDDLIKRYLTFLETEVISDSQSKCGFIIAFKSIDALAYSQALLRAGMYYTVIDPRYPADRIKAILSDGKPSVVYTDQDEAYLSNLLPGNGDAALITENEIANVCVRQYSTKSISKMKPSASECVEVSEESLAFVLYTSGSTGIPKGVQIRHSNAYYSVNWAQRCFQFSGDEIFLNQAHMGFDFCVLDYYNAWFVGAKIILVPEYISVFAAQVVELIKQENVTNIWMVPSNIISLIDRGGLLSLHSTQLRRFLYAGEPFPIKYLKMIYDWMEGNNVYNLYGPAETNLVTYHKVVTDDFARNDIPIGIPLEGTQIKLEQHDGEITHCGKGDLLVSSPSVFPGYTNRADLNQSKLLMIDGQRWYKTGDICEMDDSGCLWFRGRVDSMIKVRGYRVELQEIEKSFSELETVKQSVVLAKPAGYENKEIHAFCVPNGKLNHDDLRQHVKTKLPAYMMPKSISIVESIPFNDRGKIDKVKLLEGTS